MLHAFLATRAHAAALDAVDPLELLRRQALIISYDARGGKPPRRLLSRQRHGARARE